MTLVIERDVTAALVGSTAQIGCVEQRGALRVLSCRFEGPWPTRPATAEDGEAVRTALERYAGALGLRLAAGP